MTIDEPTTVAAGHLVTTAASTAAPTGIQGIDVDKILESIGTDKAALAS